jgi:hypothetical protein
MATIPIAVTGQRAVNQRRQAKTDFHEMRMGVAAVSSVVVASMEENGATRERSKESERIWRANRARE